MDRMIFTAMNALANMREQRIVQAQNLANINVPGYRRDTGPLGETRFLDALRAHDSRAFQVQDGTNGFSDTPGSLNQTGQELDIAIADRGFFYVQPENGAPALSRRGDLRVAADGILRNGTGDMMLDAGLAPMEVPPHRSIHITDLGEVHIMPIDGAPGQTVLVGTLATVVPDAETSLQKGLDGEIRAPDGTIPPPNQQAEVLQGVLEMSNVNPVEEMIAGIELQRQFEIGMQVILSARELDEAGVEVMRAPQI